jgi:hypothetical protein
LLYFDLQEKISSSFATDLFLYFWKIFLFAVYENYNFLLLLLLKELIIDNGVFTLLILVKNPLRTENEEPPPWDNAADAELITCEASFLIYKLNFFLSLISLSS